jgi:hypothetical protein
MWWEKSKQAYATGLPENDFDKKLDLINKLVATLKCQRDSTSPKNLPAIMETGCESFAMDLHVFDKNGQALRINDFEFNELLQIVKQKRHKLSGKQTSSLQDFTSNTVDNEQVCTLLIKINLEFSQIPSQLDGELMITFVREDTHIPCYESYRITDLLNSKPVFLLLEDFDLDSPKQLRIKIDSFMSKIQVLPGFINEIQHDMLCFKNSMYSQLFASKHAFTKSVDLNLLDNAGAKLCLHGEILMHEDRERLEMELKQRQINTYQPLLPLNAKPSLLALSEKDCVYLTFDFANLSLVDTQSDHLQLVICAMDSNKNTIKVSLSDRN